MEDATSAMARRQAAGVDVEVEVEVGHQLPMSSPTNQPPPKRRRSQAPTTDCCWTCRLRKVKCTGKPEGGDACTNCARLELTCSFKDPNEPPRELVVSRSTPSRSHTEAGTVRKRAQRACTECHSHKTRCSGDLPRCKRCEACDLNCEYTPAKRKFQHVPVSSVSVKSDSDDAGLSSVPRDGLSPEGTEASQTATATSSGMAVLPDLAILAKENILAKKDLVLRHVDAFFEHLYFTPCLGFLHKATTYKELDEGRFPAPKAAAVCSVSAFFVSPGPKAYEFAQRCSLHVEFAIFGQVGSLKEANLHLYVLDLLHNQMTGKYAKCWQLMAVACRLMIGLQLCWEVPGPKRSFRDQETSRRLAWFIFHLDRVFAGGFETYVCCSEDNMKIRLPCPEENFNDDREVQVERLNDKPSRGRTFMGLHAYQIRLMSIRHHVLRMSKKFASGPSYLQQERWEVSRVMEDVKSLQQELSSFSTSLPAELRLSDQNISHWLRRPERQVFQFLHTWLCTLHIDLYRFSLPSIREKGTPELLKILPRDFIVKSQKQAVAHAVALSRFWDACLREAATISDGQSVLLGDYNIMPCVQQCTKVLITAQQHRLYEDLHSQTTAPLWHNEPVTDESIRSLIDINLRVLEPWAGIIPAIKPQYEGIVKSVKDFDRTRNYDEAGIGFPGVKFSHPTKLPGPHYILEKAILSQKDEDDSQPPPNLAMAARFYSGAAQPDSHDAYAGVNALQGEWNSEFCPPGMPMTLAYARGLPTDSPDSAGPAYDGMSASSSHVDSDSLTANPSYALRGDTRDLSTLSGHEGPQPAFSAPQHFGSSFYEGTSNGQAPRDYTHGK